MMMCVQYGCFVRTLHQKGKIMARPVTKDRASVLSQRVDLRVRDDEHKRWVEAARKQGQTLSEWVRAVLDRAARTG